MESGVCLRPGHQRNLMLARPFDLVAGKQEWLQALADAERFARARPADELGCLYSSAALDRFALPAAGTSLAARGIVPRRGRPGGVVPRIP